MIKGLLLLSFALLSHSLWAKCEEYRKIHGLIHLKDKTWELTHVNKKSVKVCKGLPLPQSPNLEVIITKGDKSFSTKIYRPLLGHWDEPTTDKKFQGGRYNIRHLTIETFVPAWYKGSKLVIKEISSKKLIIESKL